MGRFGVKGIEQKEYVSFVTTYKAVMYRIAYGYLGDDVKALDAVDEAVYLGYLHRKELREQELLKTWLTRILINECYRVLKKDKREVPVQELPPVISPPSDLSLPVKLAVQSLPEELRKVIVLRYLGGYTITDTALILELPEGTVSSRARKALAMLRLDLDDEEGGVSYGK
jgi:RNA polymerase sigma-70 factor (ECF subfamily)